MASKRGQRRREQRKVCGAKRSYPDLKAAQSAKVLMINHGKLYAKEMWGYHCRFCGKFHLGHKRGSKRRAANDIRDGLAAVLAWAGGTTS